MSFRFSKNINTNGHCFIENQGKIGHRCTVCYSYPIIRTSVQWLKKHQTFVGDLTFVRGFVGIFLEFIHLKVWMQHRQIGQNVWYICGCLELIHNAVRMWSANICSRLLRRFKVILVILLKISMNLNWILKNVCEILMINFITKIFASM